MFSMEELRYEVVQNINYSLSNSITDYYSISDTLLQKLHRKIAYVF